MSPYQSPPASPIEALGMAELRGVSLPAVEYCGVVAIMHSSESVRMPFKSGAEGHTEAQMYMHGEPLGQAGEPASVQLLPTSGNILIMARHQLIDTRNELADDWHRIPLDGTDLTLAIMRSIKQRPINGVCYDACVSYLLDPLRKQEHVYFALADSETLEQLIIPYPTLEEQPN
jgi:hypothetical protein